MILAKEKLDYQLPQEQPELQQQQAKQRKMSRKAVVRHKMLLTFMVLCCFVMGVMVAYYYAQVAYVGIQIDALQRKVADLRLESHSLEQEVTRIVALGQIEKIATNELGMVKPNAENVVLVSNNAVSNSDTKAVANTTTETEKEEQLETITLPESEINNTKHKNKVIQAFADMVQRWNS